VFDGGMLVWDEGGRDGAEPREGNCLGFTRPHDMVDFLELD
jgi:hypothetical protein